jgi:hypothetical protein
MIIMTPPSVQDDSIEHEYQSMSLDRDGKEQGWKLEPGPYPAHA